MNGHQSNNPDRFLLPKLQRECEVKPDTPGAWKLRPSGDFGAVASSLDFKPPGPEIKNVSSIPHMWARPLSMEMALHDISNPIRPQMIEQWQGMLAAIALAEVRGFDLKAELLELADLTKPDPQYPLKQPDHLVRALFNLCPFSPDNPLPDNALYRLTKEDSNLNPWLDIYLFLWKGKPVGMSSPSTLVCPSEEGDWAGLPWWSSGRLRSPTNHLNAEEKVQLWLWLQNLQRALYNYGGREGAISRIAGLLREFQADLGASSGKDLDLSDQRQFFGETLNRGVLTALNRPIKVQPRDSSVRLIPSPAKGTVPDLLIIAPDIAKKWYERPQDIWIYETTNLASLKLDDLRQRKIIWNVEWIESQDLFLPEFCFIDQENALPGGLLPTVNVNGRPGPLIYEGQPITPLVPINPKLLQYFTPEDLVGTKTPVVKFESINNGTEVRVTLDLPLSGTDGNSPRIYRTTKDYPLKSDNALPQVPVLEVWPNFRADYWRQYYALYYDGEYGEDTFQVSLPNPNETHSFKYGKASCQIAQLAEFPSFIECRSAGNLLGLIFLKTPEPVGTTSASPWKVGVDFGTSFTNVYVNRNGVPERLKLEPLEFGVTKSSTTDRLLSLSEYFMLSDALVLPLPGVLPLSSILTTKGSNGQTRPILDGRIYLPIRVKQFKPQEDWIKTDLKWLTSNLEFNRLFLKHLALQITAQAVKSSVKQIQWSLSYPSAFSQRDRGLYARTWQNLTKDLQDSTNDSQGEPGVIHRCPDANNLNYYRTESLTVAQYFADHEDYNLVNSTCIDMGGGTSDISIWEEKNLANTLVHQCSVQLAGKDLFSQFLELNPKFLERHLTADASEWATLKGGKFSAKLDAFLRAASDRWLKEGRDLVADKAEFQELIQLTAIGITGLYYYVGLLLKALHREGKYAQNKGQDEITIPRVHLGGNGSRFLNWLAEGGEFDHTSEVNKLLSRMLSQGSGFKDTREITRLSRSPKDEVACGLVLDESKLYGLTEEEEDLLIAGENCEVNGAWLSWDARLPSKDITEFKVSPSLDHLRQFLKNFHDALRELRIEGIKPLANYKDNEKLWLDTSTQVTASLVKMKGSVDDIRLEPPFILGLKALLYVLGRQWAEKWKKKSS